MHDQWAYVVSPVLDIITKRILSACPALCLLAEHGSVQAQHTLSSTLCHTPADSIFTRKFSASYS
jgi:hypothetical protein